MTFVGKKYGLEVLCPVDDKGVLTEEAPGFEGLFYDKATANYRKIRRSRRITEANIHYAFIST